MWAFFCIAFLIYGGMHVYAFTKIWQALPQSASLGVTLTLLGLALTLSPFALLFGARQNGHGAIAVLSWPIYLWMGFIVLFCLVAFAFDLGKLLFVGIGLTWPLGGLPGLIIPGLLALTLSGYSLYDARQLRVERITVSTPKLKTGRVTIAQISDLHLGVMLNHGFLEDVLAKVCTAHPDVLVATGDILDGQGDDLDRLAQRLRTCTAPIGKFAVLGNHEYFLGLEESLRFLREAGFTVLRGDAVTAGGLVFAGVDDATGRALGKETRLDATAALNRVPSDAFVVLLKHQPVVDMNTRFDLQLSGHIHGGQLFPAHLLTQLVYKVRAGLTRLPEGRWLYVSRGAGTWGPPMRLLASPEVTLITIEAAPPEGQPEPRNDSAPGQS